MCPTETIPPVDRLARIVETLEAREQISDEPQDIHEIDHGTFDPPLPIIEMISTLR